MNINITDPEMLKKMEKALQMGGDIHTLEDIGAALECGDMQSHSEGDTWVITQVVDYPKKRVLDIVYVVGSVEGALLTEKSLIEWAKNMGVDRMTAIGREGWEQLLTDNPGWKKAGTLFVKELNHGR